MRDTYMLWHICSYNTTSGSQFSLSAIWVQGRGVRSLDLVASAPSHSAVISIPVPRPSNLRFLRTHYATAEDDLNEQSQLFR